VLHDSTARTDLTTVALSLSSCCEVLSRGLPCQFGTRCGKSGGRPANPLQPFPCKADFRRGRQASHSRLAHQLDATSKPCVSAAPFGAMYREKLLSAEGLDSSDPCGRTARFPELVTSFYRTGPAQTAARLPPSKEAMTTGRNASRVPRRSPPFAAVYAGRREAAILRGIRPTYPESVADHESGLICVLAPTSIDSSNCGELGGRGTHFALVICFLRTADRRPPVAPGRFDKSSSQAPKSRPFGRKDPKESSPRRSGVSLCTWRQPERLTQGLLVGVQRDEQAAVAC